MRSAALAAKCNEIKSNEWASMLGDAPTNARLRTSYY